MSKFLVVLFPTEAKAREGSQAFRDLHDEGSITLYGRALVAKEDDCKVVIKEMADEDISGSAIGLLAGSIVGLLGGPAGIALGAAGGGLLGLMRDLTHAGVGANFVNDVGQKLEPGMVAVVAEVDEDWISPVDMRLGELDGTIIRSPRAVFLEQQLEHDVQALDAELVHLQDELQQASDEAKAVLDTRVLEVRTSLREAQDQVKTRLDRLETEARAKIDELQDQASRFDHETKVRLEKRIEERRADYNARIEKLRQARGAVELIIASIALEAGLFRHPDPTVANLFSALVITAVVTTLVMPFGLRVILKGKRYSE